MGLMREQWDMDNSFLPVTEAYAVDYDGDNNADLFNSKSDAIVLQNYLPNSWVAALKRYHQSDVI